VGSGAVAGVCLGDWRVFRFQLQLRDPQTAVNYDVEGTGTPDRSIDSDGDSVTANEAKFSTLEGNGPPRRLTITDDDQEVD
jgi:hypothetical protein